MPEINPGRYPSQLKYMTALKSFTSNIVLADLTGLTGFAIAADTYYALRGMLLISDAGGDFSLGLNFDNAPQSELIGIVGANVAGTLYGDAETAGANMSAVITNASQAVFAINGVIRGHATLAAVMSLQGAQLVSNAGLTVFGVGSWVELVRL